MFVKRLFNFIGIIDVYVNNIGDIFSYVPGTFLMVNKYKW